MRDKKWIDELRSLVNRYGVDTELDAPDWIIAYHMNMFLNSIRQFSVHDGYTPLNNMGGTILQQTTAKVRRNPKLPKR